MELVELKDVDLTLKDLTTEIVKYQKFKTKSFIKYAKIKDNYSDKTLRNYFDCGLTYIKTGKQRKICSKKFYKHIDLALEEHVQPLTPSIEDKRREFKNAYCKKDAKLPIAEEVKRMTSSNLTERFEYGVRYNDNVKVFRTQQEAVMFLSGVLFAADDSCDARLVSVQNLDGFN